MRLLLILVVLATAGCASSQMVSYSVSSRPPGAQVDVNGVTMGYTPTKISLQCSKRWVGVFNAPGGWAYDSAIYEITVYPSVDRPGLSQTKKVDACQARNMETPGVMFDLSLEGVAPRQTLDVNVDSKDHANAVDNLEQTLRQLSDLHDRGILTDDEYEQKRAEIIRSFSSH